LSSRALARDLRCALRVPHLYRGPGQSSGPSLRDKKRHNLAS
jgi:hypothetical protein